MGNTQFYSPLKSSVDQIQAATNTINANVETLKNTDIGNLNTKVDGLGWWTKYNVQKITNTNSTRSTMIDVNGKSGLFSLNYVNPLSNGAYLYGLKIVVDGVVWEDWTNINKYTVASYTINRYGIKGYVEIGPGVTAGVVANLNKWYMHSSNYQTQVIPQPRFHMNFDFIPFKNSLMIASAVDPAAAGSTYFDLEVWSL